MKTSRNFYKFFIRIAASAAAAFLLCWLVMKYSPYPQLNQFLSRPNSIRYYDRNGYLLQITPLEQGLRRERLGEIPKYVKDIFVFSEDRRFFTHSGVDSLSLFRALFQNTAQGRRVSGASTITMQLARLIADNSSPVKDQSFFQKIKEAVNAFRLEARFSKDEILELYLNSLPFGYNTEGTASAAKTFFASELSALSPSQVFVLAVIPRRPSLYNPVENPDLCIAAAAELHRRFINNKKFISSWSLFKQMDERDFHFAVSSAKRFAYPFEFPHLIRSINNLFLSSGSYPSEIHLSVDLALQHFLENKIAGAAAQYYSSRLTNGAAIVIENETGEILAWVGSADFFNAQAAGQIDGVLALNQSGSSMKPFLYAMALEHGFKPADVIADILMTFGESELYIPRNFNERFNGPVLFRAALASSLNIPAVYLLYRLGVRNYANLLLSLGFDSIENSANDAGLGLSLGNAPVSLLELVRAFSVFPRDGLYLPLTWQKTDEKPEKEERRIYSKDTARIICSFLSDPGARTIAFGRGRNFITEYPAIFKTGTANQYQSIVALGATKRYTAGVWMGNFTGETVIGRTGSSVPAAIARETLDFLENAGGNANMNFPEPENWVTKRVCAVSGMMPHEACLSVINEFVQPEETGVFCTWHRIADGKSVTVFPAEYQSWFTSVQRQGYLDFSSRPLEIINPRSGFVYLSGPGIGSGEIPAEVTGGEGDILHVTHNGSSFRINRPFVFYLPRIRGINTLHVQNGDEENTVTFTVE